MPSALRELAVASAVLYRPRSCIPSTSATELFVSGAVADEEMAEVLVTISQGSPPAVT